MMTGTTYLNLVNGFVAEHSIKDLFFGTCSMLDLVKIAKLFLDRKFHCFQPKEPCLRRKYGVSQDMLSDPCLST